MSDNSLPIHSLFDDPEADLIFQSVDGVQFRLQRKYLEANTGAFPSAEFDTRGAITYLTETSTVLGTLFQFVYPRRHPDLEDMDFDTVAALAEAAEKYEVFSAMTICHIRMRQFLHSHAAGILTYAVRHDYPKLIQDAAPLLVRLPMSAVLPHLPSSFFEPWARYHEAWDNVFEDALKKITEMNKVNITQEYISREGWGTTQTRGRGTHVCYACLFTMTTVVKDLQSIKSVQDLKVSLAIPRVVPICCLSSPGSCQYITAMTKLCADMSAKTKEIPLFATFISGT